MSDAIPPPYTPHATVDIPVQAESAAATAGAAGSTDKNKKKLGVADRFLHSVISGFWFIVFIAGLVGTYSAIFSTTYMFSGNTFWTVYLWIAFPKQMPSSALYGLFGPPSLLYLKLAAFGGALVGFLGTAVIGVVILLLSPFCKGEKGKKKALKEKFLKPWKTMKKLTLGRAAIYTFTWVFPPLAAYAGMKALPLVFGPEALVTTDGETANMTRALVCPVIGMAYRKLAVALLAKLKNFRKKVRVGDEETQSQDQPSVELDSRSAGGSGAEQVPTVEPESVGKVEKPLVDV